MKRIKRIVTLFLVTTAILLSFTIQIGAFADCQAINDSQLAAVDGDTLHFDNLAINLTESGLLFDYEGTTDNVFQHASGLFVITPVSGDYNTVNVNLDLRIILITGNTINIDLSDVDINF